MKNSNRCLKLKNIKLFEQPCPKCENGSENVTLKYYHPGQIEEEHTRLVECDNDMVEVENRIIGSLVEVYKECLLHYCTKCHYNWWTKTKDIQVYESMKKEFHSNTNRRGVR